jgi:hypothetical protein
MKKVKIIQITSASEKSDILCDAILYGLGDDGSVYYWGKESRVQYENDGSSSLYYVYGWIEMKDNINN